MPMRCPIGLPENVSGHKGSLDQYQKAEVKAAHFDSEPISERAAGSPVRRKGETISYVQILSLTGESHLGLNSRLTLCTRRHSVINAERLADGEGFARHLPLETGKLKQGFPLCSS